LNGFLGCAEDWDELRAALGMECVAIDLPGHGSDPEPVEALTFEGGVEQVRRQITARGLDRCHILGYSMGGRVALGLAAWHPQLVASVVAIGAGAGIEDDFEREQRRQADDRLADQLESDFAGFLDLWYGLDLFAPLRAHPSFPRMLERRRRGDPAHVARAMRAFSIGRQPCLHEELAAAKMRILLLAGALDAKFAASNARLADRCPACENRTIPDAGHSPHLENPPELARLARDFVARQAHQEQSDDSP
jgi:2-succinyl-6-hydroxy-2,4-cyclohexadiene-1-carboxylate synthase